MFIPPRLAPCYYDGKSSLYIADSVAYCYPEFMDVRQARKINLSALMKRYRSDRAFADAVGIAPAHVSQMKHGRRQLGDEVARRIESALHYPRGWMDHPHDDDQTSDLPALPAPSGDAIAALLPNATPRSRTSLERIADAYREGRLADADLELLNRIAERIAEQGPAPEAPIKEDPRKAALKALIDQLGDDQLDAAFRHSPDGDCERQPAAPPTLDPAAPAFPAPLRRTG